ncbi:hypothetical protein [Burkholderia pseudomultivorans]|uniref:hypothetical protein n=1 Tax=Burkholderia pseudomultivorans TaxID=1207504 RepID=UPI001581B35B|nr:hypothetical protein [Burkholderia pseudomultivorans]
MNKALLLYVGSRFVRHPALRRLSDALQAQAVPIAGVEFATRKTRVFAGERSGKSRFKPARQTGIRAPLQRFRTTHAPHVASHVARRFSK